MIYSPEKKKMVVRIRAPAITFIKFNFNPIKCCSLCLRRPSSITSIVLVLVLVLVHVVSAFAGHQLLILYLSGRLGPPSPPPPMLTPFLSGPREQPVSMSGIPTMATCTIILNSESWSSLHKVERTRVPPKKYSQNLAELWIRNNYFSDLALALISDWDPDSALALFLNPDSNPDC